MLNDIIRLRKISNGGSVNVACAPSSSMVTLSIQIGSPRHGVLVQRSFCVDPGGFIQRSFSILLEDLCKSVMFCKDDETVAFDIPEGTNLVTICHSRSVCNFIASKADERDAYVNGQYVYTVGKQAVIHCLDKIVFHDGDLDDKDVWKRSVFLRIKSTSFSTPDGHFADELSAISSEGYVLVRSKWVIDKQMFPSINDSRPGFLEDGIAIDGVTAKQVVRIAKTMATDKCAIINGQDELGLDMVGFSFLDEDGSTKVWARLVKVKRPGKMDAVADQERTSSRIFAKTQDLIDALEVVGVDGMMCFRFTEILASGGTIDVSSGTGQFSRKVTIPSTHQEFEDAVVAVNADWRLLRDMLLLGPTDGEVKIDVSEDSDKYAHKIVFLGSRENESRTFVFMGMTL